MANALAEAGIGGAYEGAMKYVTSERLISRTHFARYLVEAGYANQVSDVFNRFLTPGKPGYVAHDWATLSQATSWIRAAGGQSVLAHPGRYKVSISGMRRLLTDFRDAEGDAIEVVSPSHTPAAVRRCSPPSAGLRAARFVRLRFSRPCRGSMDFRELPDLPAGVVPVWNDW
jgi:predicted metal-dependent phosphoesterase TrpH